VITAIACVAAAGVLVVMYRSELPRP
jgi:hypothetical protein